jgi:glycosyltransferase involved in cell wall biosynthesis
MRIDRRRFTAPPRRVLIYTHSLAGGGAERSCALLASGLAQNGHDVLLATDYESADNAPYVDPGVRRVTIGRGHPRGVLRLARLIARERPDASISAMGSSNIKHLAAATIAGRRRMAILSYHGYYDSEPKLLSRMSFALTPLLTRASARTIVVSSNLRENLIRRWRADPLRTSRIYNPIAWGPPSEPPSAEQLRSRAPLVLASGRLTPLKGFDSLLRAFARVEPRDARLVILGEGPELGALRSEAERLGLADRVDFPGYVAEPWDFYARAKCFVVSSRSESFGMVVVEALAHGLPVVATDCSGPAEILCNGMFGRIVPIGDEAAMAGAVSATLADPGDPAPRVRRANRFSSDRAIARYERLIENVRAEAAAAAMVYAIA